MKKIIALILSLLFIFSVCCVGYAEFSTSPDIQNSFVALYDGEEPEITDEPTTDEPTTDEPTTDEPDEDENKYHVPPATKPGAVARIYLCSKLSAVGHIFVYVENLTDHQIPVGLMTLEKDQGVSMGAFGMTQYDGAGIYFNSESYRYKEKDYNTLIALCEEIDQAHLDKLNSHLQYANHWDIFINCVFFAVGVWNSCTNDFVLPTPFPITVRLQIALRKHTTFSEMYVPPRDKVCHMVGNGKNAYLIICCDKTVNKK